MIRPAMASKPAAFQRGEPYHRYFGIPFKKIAAIFNQLRASCQLDDRAAVNEARCPRSPLRQHAGPRAGGKVLLGEVSGLGNVDLYRLEAFG